MITREGPTAADGVPVTALLEGPTAADDRHVMIPLQGPTAADGVHVSTPRGGLTAATGALVTPLLEGPTAATVCRSRLRVRVPRRPTVCLSRLRWRAPMRLSGGFSGGPGAVLEWFSKRLGSLLVLKNAHALQSAVASRISNSLCAEAPGRIPVIRPTRPDPAFSQRVW